MGTRHLTIIKDNDDTEIAVMYGQWDGYISGYGKDLKKFLNGFYIVNGYTKNDEEEGVKSANGMGCLAAQIVAHFKKKIGSFHLEPSGTRGIGEEYIYTVYVNVNDKHIKKNLPPPLQLVSIKVENKRNVIYDGLVSDFNPSED